MQATLAEHPEIRKMKDYYDKGQDIPWQRVWGWVEESHVRFNHAPHIREGIDCTTCHGDVSRDDSSHASCRSHRWSSASVVTGRGTPRTIA